MNHGQTACLAVDGQFVAEECFGGQIVLRHLTGKRKRTDKNNENEQTSKTNLLRMSWNFYGSNSKINKEFRNNN